MTEEREINLEELFPNMKPVSGAPPLFRINGCGFGMYGRRDVHPPTGAYLSTYCLCLLFIPVLPIKAYRVADAPDGGGWYFLGKERLSGFARTWNQILVVSALVFIGYGWWLSHTQSPAYLDRKQASAAAELMEEGKNLEAAKSYRELLRRSVTQKDAARTGLTAIYEAAKGGELDRGKLDILKLLAAAKKNDKNLFPGLEDEAFSLAAKAKDTDARLARECLALSSDLGKSAVEVKKLDLALLKVIVDKNPRDRDAAVELGEHYHKLKQFEKMQAVLMPVKEKLGTSDLAGVLGQRLLKDRRHDEAYAVLLPYVEAKRQALGQAEKDYRNARERAYNIALRDLNKLGPSSPVYRKLTSIKDKKKQGAAVDAHLFSMIKDDKSIKNALNRLIAAARFVPAAMDLGMLQLSRAQKMADPAGRKKELEAAEKTFLSISSVAAGSDRYELSLIEVYYWLGKEKEGARQVKRFLALKKRAFASLMEVAHILRRIGLLSQSKNLLKEAYEKAKGDEKDYAIHMLAIMSDTLDEKVKWLEKGTSQSTKVELESARGRLAQQAGDITKAEVHYKAAIAGYMKREPTTSTLNNMALGYLALFDLKGNPRDFRKGTELMKRAVAMNPSNAILMFNTCSTLIRGAIVDTLGDRLPIALVRQGADEAMFGYLYAKEDQYFAINKQVRNCKSFQQACDYMKRLYVLAPKSMSTYTQGLGIASFHRDPAMVKELIGRMRQAKISTDEQKDEYLAKLKTHKVERKNKLAETLSSLRRYSETYEACKKRGKTAHAMAAVRMVELQIGAARAGHPVNRDKLVDLAQKACADLPSSRTYGCLRDAHALRACLAMAERSDEFRRIWHDCMDLVEPEVLLAYLMVHSSDRFAELPRSADVQRICRLVEQKCELRPSLVTATDWGLVKKGNPALAARIKASHLEDEFQKQSHRLTEKYFNYTLDAMAIACIRAHLKGQEEKAKRIADLGIRDLLGLSRL